MIVSYKNLNDDLRALFKELYPDGYKDYLQRTVKPNGESIFTVPMETDDTCYLVKFDVKIDSTMIEDELDKDIYDDKNSDNDDFESISEAMDKDDDEAPVGRVGKLKHGSYEDLQALVDSPDEDEDTDDDDDEEEDDDINDEPNDDDLLDKYMEDEEEPDDDDLLALEQGLIGDDGEIIDLEKHLPKNKKTASGKKAQPTVAAAAKNGKTAKTAAKTTAKTTAAKTTKKGAAQTTAAKTTAAKTASSKTTATGKAATAKKAAPAPQGKQTAKTAKTATAKPAAKTPVKATKTSTAKTEAVKTTATATKKSSTTKLATSSTSKSRKKVSAKAAEQAAMAAKAILAKKSANRKKK
ncbi:MAG: hypothetical protein IJU81_04585 [Bacteroidales bacterium]|nr:hypothetical protein [Bacteroidales bacterium]